MSRTLPDLLISYELPFPEAAIRSFEEAVEAPGLDLVVEPRPPSGPFAGLLWLLPTTVVIWFGKSYFDGFLKEAGKDHYALVKRGISSLWPTFFGESRSVRVTAVGTRGKIRHGDDKYSLGLSIFAEADSGMHFKLLFPDDLSAEGFTDATANFLDFLKRYYSGDLDPVTAMQISAVRKVARTILVTYDPDQRLFKFPDPVPKELDSAK